MSYPKEQEKYNQLAYYTLSHPDYDFFIHQYVVDVFAAQNADEKTKPITITFALVGLYLAVEKGYSGKEMQKTHILLARKRKSWPIFDLPKDRGNLRIGNILAVAPGSERDEVIKKWCKSVWLAYAESREKIIQLLENEFD